MPAQGSFFGRTQMRGPSRRVRSETNAHSGRPRPLARRAGPRTAYALTAFFLLFSLLAPFAATTVAAPVPVETLDAAANAPRDDAPPPFPAPNRVVVVGDFQ